MSTNQKYLLCALSLLVSSQAVGMRQVTSRTGATVGRALGAGVVSPVARHFSNNSLGFSQEQVKEMDEFEKTKHVNRANMDRKDLAKHDEVIGYFKEDIMKDPKALYKILADAMPRYKDQMEKEYPRNIIAEVLKKHPDTIITDRDWRNAASHPNSDHFSDMLKAGRRPPVDSDVSDVNRFPNSFKTFASSRISIKNIPIAVQNKLPFDQIPQKIDFLEKMRGDIKAGSISPRELNESDIDNAVNALKSQHAENQARMKEQKEEAAAKFQKEWTEGSLSDRGRLISESTKQKFEESGYADKARLVQESLAHKAKYVSDHARYRASSWFGKK
ncbi:MAG: hypothetical protein NTU89_00285 [Candidatus Dependentiae bacterium]|nr:hypothetical protein [Candidatus Dependentiae bacterium]